MGRRRLSLLIVVLINQGNDRKYDHAELKEFSPCNHACHPLSFDREQEEVYHPRMDSRRTAYRGTGSTDYRITQDSRKCKKKAGHIGCSHAAICPVCAYSAFIQRVTCCFSFRSVYTKNAPHRRICTRKEAGVARLMGNSSLVRRLMTKLSTSRTPAASAPAAQTGSGGGKYRPGQNYVFLS